jgi:glycosyltransferase involved in cell wall biosynthesis
MAVERILVCEAQVPFVTGGAEYLVQSLVQQLVEHGYQTSVVSLPFKSYPKEGILPHAAAWRLLDLSESNGESVDLLITTKFPTYFARHSNKVSWLVHQHRSAYELCGTEFSDFHHTELDVGLREQLIALDGQMLGESRRLFTIAQNTSNRLKTFNGLSSEPLYHPPRLADRLKSGVYGDYILSVGRLELIKRTDLLVKAMQWVDSPIRLVVVGEGTQRAALEALAEKTGVADRVEFRGAADDEDLVALYESALGVAYVPYDEDYGYVTLEAFLARRPVVTAVDSGGTLEFVEDGVNGLVCESEPEAIATHINRVAADRSLASSLGAAGFERARQVTWDGVVEKLVGTA